MGFFKMNYGFYAPYMVIVDPQFFQMCVTKKVNLLVMLERVLNGNVKVFVTRCIQHDCNQNGIEIPKLNHLECSHNDHVSSEDCIKSIIDENPKYCICVQDESFRKELAFIPGVPLLYLTNNIMMLETPSMASKNVIHQRERLTEKTPNDIRIIAKKVKKDMHKEETEEETSQFNKSIRFVTRQNKKAKGPHPLSVKKNRKKARINLHLKILKRRKKGKEREIEDQLETWRARMGTIQINKMLINKMLINKMVIILIWVKK